MTFSFPFDIQAEQHSGVPALKGTFGRINVVLGANGSGKSRLLQRLINTRGSIFQGFAEVVSVEGGRAIEIQPDVGASPNTYHIFTNPVSAETQHKQQTSLSQRLKQTFILIQSLHRLDKEDIADQFIKWKNSGEYPPSPEPKEFRFDKLKRMFSEIFPTLELFVTTSQQLYVRVSNHDYPASNLSEGEKQVLAILADLVILNKEKSIFVIDEPELNLHPELAERLWSILEMQYPDCVFIYATHNLSFALRCEVDEIFCLGVGQLSKDDLFSETVNTLPFLGSIPGLVSCRKCLFVEGHPGSIDKQFYRWITGLADLSIVPLAGSGDVIAASARTGVWNLLPPQLKIAGVIDRDFRSSLTDLPGEIHVIELHEAESYLCQPSLVLALQNALSNVAPTSEQEIVEIIVAHAKETLLPVVAQRVFAKSIISHGLSVPRSTLKTITTSEQLAKLLSKEAADFFVTAGADFDERKIRDEINTQMAYCQSLIDSKDVPKILQIFEGKNLVRKLCHKAGCDGPASMIMAANKHLDLTNFPSMVALKSALLAKLN